jgi:hypothetical protein
MFLLRQNHSTAILSIVFRRGASLVVSNHVVVRMRAQPVPKAASSWITVRSLAMKFTISMPTGKKGWIASSSGAAAGGGGIIFLKNMVARHKIEAGLDRRR